MRRVTAGIDEHGKSCIVEDVEVGPELAMDGFERHVVYDAEPIPPPRPVGNGSFFPMEIDPGVARFYFAKWEPGAGGDVPFHHTDTVDLGYLISGSIELLLDDGAHAISAGDCFVVPGIDHSWRIGTEGCHICTTSIGTPPLD
jgi:quercetin dioxygenase-like cupin family protein